MKKFVISAVLVGVALGTANVFFGDEASVPKKEPPTIKADDTGKDGGEGKPSVWMRLKLKSTEGVLAGLAAGDFEAIGKNAKRMNTFSGLERLARGKNEDYQLQMKYFRYANRELIRQAGEENLDGATMAFMQLTTSCVNCHRAVRDTEASVANAPSPFTHVVQSEADYYLDGPQQSRPPEGRFAKGTKVRVIKAAGSYSQVKSENGVVAFVSAAVLVPATARQRR